MMTTKMLSHYELLEPLGEGGMGTVYRALDTRLGRPVAVKVLRGEAALSSESRKRFVQEAKAASGLNHPHIITIYDIGQDEGVDFIAMEYVAGQSLARLIGRPGTKLEDMLTRAVQIADALAAAHAAGIVHRDLKPANIMVSDTGSVKVLDFGLAKLTKPAAFAPFDDLASTETQAVHEPLTEQGAVLGTTPYMSPEQAEGKATDARSDVFSFGAVLYEMVTGRRAFDGETKMSTLAAILEREPTPPSELNPAVSSDLEKVIARCLRKDRQRRWHSMADVKVALEEVRDEPPAAAGSAASIRSGRSVARVTWLVAASVIVVGSVTVIVWPRTPARAPVPVAPLTRLTSDIGWTDYPAISPDGRILAYASDRSGDGNLDIWIQQIPNGEPVRLTRNAADDVDPTFSADGSRIAFHSSRSHDGIYVVPTLGGEERLLIGRGFSPRFSPDGLWIAYGVSEAAGSQVYVASATGGPGRKVAPGFYLVRAPVWSPDGRELLFWGQRDRDAPPENNVDWYLAAVQGGAPKRTTARDTLRRERFEAFHALPTPDAWVAAGNRVLFHGHVGDSWNTWQAVISPDRGEVAPPRRVTFGTTDEAAASTSSTGRMVFMSRTSGADIWSLPIDSDRGRIRGALIRVTQDLADDYDPSLSADGRMLAFRSRRAGQFDVFSRDLTTGREIAVTATTADDTPVISPDGTRIAYSFRDAGKTPIFAVALTGGSPEKLCDDCGEVEQWTPRGSEILFVTARDPSGIGLLRLGAAPNREWLTHSQFGLFNARVSPDGRWISFNARANSLAPARVMLAEVRNSLVVDEKDWFHVSDDGDAPAWSPDGTLLYFWSNRDGSPCLWAQRLDPLTKGPTGPPQAIQHFHSRGLSWRNLYLGAPDIVVARDKILFNLGEHSGNVWMTEVPPVDQP